jgi:hypothetical protein
MNNLVISLYPIDSTISATKHTHLITLEPIFDLDKGKAWHGTIKVGDSTIGVYASSLCVIAPVDKEEYPKSIG